MVWFEGLCVVVDLWLSEDVGLRREPSECNIKMVWFEGLCVVVDL